MSWQDFEYGPADDDTDHLIDAGWLTPEEAEEKETEIASLKRDLDNFKRKYEKDYLLHFACGCICGVVGLCMVLSLLGVTWN